MVVVSASATTDPAGRRGRTGVPPLAMAAATTSRGSTAPPLAATATSTAYFVAGWPPLPQPRRRALTWATQSVP
jgi:hypothetical protein